MTDKDVSDSDLTEVVVTEADATDAVATAKDAQGRRLPAVLRVATLVVVLAGTALRLWGLGTQSYWTDELFSVQQAAGGLAHAWQAGLVEFQPPTYAVLLTGWMALNPALATTLVWTRLLSALVGAAAVAVAWTSLRGTRISAEGRALAVAAIASSGFAIVYAQEARSYSLLLLAATGLTGATVRWALVERDRAADPVPWVSWLAWALLASMTHLFGLLLAVCAATVVLAVRRSFHDLVRLVALVAVVAVPQAAWISFGASHDGFGAGTDWIPAPGSSDLADLLTSTFASGSLVPEDGGFPWVSRLGVLAVVVLLAAAATAGTVLRRRRVAGMPGQVAENPEAADGPADGRAAAVLLGVAGLLVVSVFVLAQVVHVWTLRNLIVVVPALTWGVALLVLGLAGAARRWFAWALLACLSASLVLTATGLPAPYKTDARAAVDYLAEARAEQPDITVVWSGSAVPQGWFLATDSPVPDGTAQAVFARAVFLSRPTYLSRVRAVPGPAVYVYYPDVAAREVDAQAAAIIARVGGPTACHQVPIHGLAVVRCDP